MAVYEMNVKNTTGQHQIMIEMHTEKNLQSVLLIIIHDIPEIVP